MAQFFGLIPLNADNFESGEATEGQVLSADGLGGAGWETPSGGGGSSGFLFDGATFTYRNAGEGYYGYYLTLTLNGVPITQNAFVNLYVQNVEFSSPAEWQNYQVEGSYGLTLFGVAGQPNDVNWLYAGDYQYAGERRLRVEHVTLNMYGTYRFVVITPSGAVVYGPDMVFAP